MSYARQSTGAGKEDFGSLGGRELEALINGALVIRFRDELALEGTNFDPAFVVDLVDAATGNDTPSFLLNQAGRRVVAQVGRQAQANFLKDLLDHCLARKQELIEGAKTIEERRGILPGLMQLEAIMTDITAKLEAIANAS